MRRCQSCIYHKNKPSKCKVYSDEIKFVPRKGVMCEVGKLKKKHQYCI